MTGSIFNPIELERIALEEDLILVLVLYPHLCQTRGWSPQILTLEPSVIPTTLGPAGMAEIGVLQISHMVTTVNR